ncbi:hypothetical protein JCM11641_007861 [Rhodosporidiobolus odoratus]
MASRTATPQPAWAQQPLAGGAGGAVGGKGLSLPGGKAGKAPAGRAGSAEADTKSAPGAAGGGGGGQEKSTDVDSLMDAVGASGVDLGAEEETLRATNERLHAQAMAAQAAAAQAGGAVNNQAYAGVDRSRKQDFIDPGLMAECVKKVAAAFQLKTLEPDTIPLIALATRHRLMSLINASIAARDHRQQSSHFRVPPFVAPSASSSSRKRRRTALDPDADVLGEDDLMDEDDDESGSSKPKVPAWNTLVYDDPERYLSVLERVEREEERKTRRERMVRDQREEEERALKEAMEASEAARLALEKEGLGPDGMPLAGGGGGKKGKAEGDEGGVGSGSGSGVKEKKISGGAGGAGNAKKKAKLKEKESAPSTPAGKEAGAKPKKAKKAKGEGGTGGGKKGDSGAATPASVAASARSAALQEDIKKRMTDQTALRSLGGQKFSWLNAGVGSPTPAGLNSVGGAGGLPKPKFAPASSLPPPSFAPGGANGLPSTSSLNPANNLSSSSLSSSSALGGSTSTLPLLSASTPASTAASALTTSRLNLPPLHDAQRTQLARDAWEGGHHVVEVGDLLFALERERGMGGGRGSGRLVGQRGRAGVTRAGYGGGGGGRGR